MSSQLTKTWLRQHLHLYSHKDRAFADIDAALSRFPTLRPKSDWHTFDDGRTQLLLCLHGLLPITFRQASYNIPINIWLTKDYPRHPPIAYVVPTSDMLVKPGKYIDVSGRCNIEYMQLWERKCEGCSLLALLEAMQNQFSREPPVYAKPKQSSLIPSSSIGVSSIAGKPPPPLPHATTANSDDRPALPPKPGSSIGSSIANHHIPYNPAVSNQPSAVIINPQPSSSTSSSSGSPPPLPPHPSLDSTLPQYHSRTIPPTYRPANTVPETTNASVQPANSSHQYWVTSPSSSVPISPPPLPPSLPQHVPSTPYIQSPSQQSFSSPAIAPHPSIPPPNLLDEDNDINTISSADQAPSTAVPPPRPPNPELLRIHAQVHQKLTSELASLSQALSLDAERLRAHQNDLLAGEPAIRDEMARLEAVKDVCQNVAGRLKDSIEQAEHNVAELRRKGDPEVDELICSTTIVHNQLINLVAEDNAIEDTIYHLHRALNAGRIDLDRFLRTTRILAEEQFMKRALIEKIQNGIPMGMSAGSGWP